MKRGTQVTLTVLTGYTLGRRRKLATALLLGAATAAGRYSGNPAELLSRGRSLIGESSTLSELSGLTKPLVKAWRAELMDGDDEEPVPVGAGRGRARGEDTEPPLRRRGSAVRR
ncbi:hypothetical protein GCM10010399_24830 [Dactylosporangium fulvum]|uniref:Uncharacterized protein n=1 Tax=Dactylosporangium fulvum TaxID=53359 RepID=A0ABY5W5Y2_9ACTN|nr:hypothetical protein [Dactylosporangium fulvum]UWP85477.1 hypothetical protein Dfulv_15045 [Dactylosporangium fulvum]